MRRIVTVIAMVMMLAVITACGKTAQQETTGAQETARNTSGTTVAPAKTTEDAGSAQTDAAPGQATESATEENSEQPAPAHSEVLVAYFSATGTTKKVAEKIASITGGDLYEIVPAEPYTTEDLNYNDRSSRSTKEQNDKSARPAIGSEDVSLTGYTTVYLGFPIWWGEEPRILDTFVEKYNFDGITVIPFCTSGSSGIGRSGSNMEELAGSGTWLQGERFSGSVSEEELKSWIEGLQ